MSLGMVRAALAVVVIAVAAPARAGELPRHFGMYAQPGPALAMLDSAIDIRVHGPIVEATITQTYRNDLDRATEATYVFPLPPDAAVSAMDIALGQRTIHAAIARREDAQRRYEDAVAAGLGAGLLDQERPDVFTQTVSAIPAHGTVKVMLRVDATAQYAAGAWQLVLPLVVAPRYVPGVASGRPTTGSGRAPDTDRAPDASRVTPAAAPGAGGATAIAIEFADAVDGVDCPTHELAHRDNRYTLVDAHSDHDAIVRWRARAPAEGWVEQDDDGGYAAIVVEAAPATKAITPGSLLLVLDRAATTRGDADAVEHPMVRALLGALAAGDRVSVTGSDRVASASGVQVMRALDDAWAKPAGVFDLTNVLGATRAGGAAVVLVSDGLVADDRGALAAARRLGGPLHVIGVGPAPNRSLLASLASATGGTLRFAVPGDDLEAIARDVLADAASPPAPLAVTWGTLAARDVVPATPPRVGVGQAALVVARVASAQRANARARGDVFAFGFVTTGKPPEGAVTPHGPIARRWARMKLDELVTAGDAAAIAAHALRYGLVSPRTSMIAIGEDVVVDGGVKHTVAVPVSVPAGMHWQEVRHQHMIDLRQPGDTTERSKGGELGGKRTADHEVAEKREPEANDAPRRPGIAKAEEPAKPEPKPEPLRKGAERQNDKNTTPIAKAPPTSVAHRHPTVTPSEPRANLGGRARPITPSSSAPPPPPPAPAQPVTGTATGSAAPVPTTTTGAPDADRKDLHGGAEDEWRAPPARELTVAALEPTALGDDGIEVIAGRGRARRLALALAAGAAIENGRGDFATALAARYERGHRTPLGLEGALWLVSGSRVEGELLGTIGRRHVARFLELGAGLGLAVGDAIGPALELVLRAPVGRVAPFLRYDGVLWLHDRTRDGQNAATVGVEARF
jgi:Ca-activated chloride channel family protein